MTRGIAVLAVSAASLCLVSGAPARAAEPDAYCVLASTGSPTHDVPGMFLSGVATASGPNVTLTCTVYGGSEASVTGNTGPVSAVASPVTILGAPQVLCTTVWVEDGGGWVSCRQIGGSGGNNPLDPVYATLDTAVATVVSVTDPVLCPILGCPG